MPYELPTAGGRIPYERAFGKKDLIQTGTAQNPIRRAPLAGGSLMSERPVRKSPFCRDQRKMKAKKMRGCCRFCSGLFLTDTAF